MTLKMVGFVRPFQANFVRLFSTVPQSRASFFIYAPIFYGEDGRYLGIYVHTVCLVRN